VRVQELARVLGVDPGQLITLLNDLGVKAADLTTLVDASLESRLKGLIRRPTTGGRGIAASRPEPTWLKSLQRPKSRGRVFLEEPEAETVPDADPEKPRPAAETERAPEPKPEVETGPERKIAADAEVEVSPKPAENAEAEPKRPALEEAADTGGGLAEERPRRRTLPSGRAPTPPPPPPERKTHGRPQTPAAGRPRPARHEGRRPDSTRPGAGHAPGRDRHAAPKAAPARPGPSRPQPSRPGPARQRSGRSGSRPLTVPSPPPEAAPPAKGDRRGTGGGGRRKAAAGGSAGRDQGFGRRWRNGHGGRKGGGRRRGKGRRRQTAELRPPQPVRQPAREVVIDGPLTVGELAERMCITAAELIKNLMNLGIMATVNQVLDPESARVAVAEMGVTVHTAPPEEGKDQEAADAAAALAGDEDTEKLEPRPPVVTVMGHVDHGKTSLLDAMRETNVTAGEAGGITQHIGASTVDWNGKRIVFVDTPGHEAFTAMRARGAQVTDIAVLVVAADDGVMPQTLEAISHARAARVPIIVALNKIDKPNALPDRVMKQLGEHGLVPEDWGGDTVVVQVSAKERRGIDDLLDMINLVAEMEEFKADPDRRAKGIVIETRLDKGLGPVASLLVKTGTLRVGDPFVVGSASGRVRAMVDDKGNRIQEAPPSTPVEVIGLDDLPEAGDLFQVLADEKMAREIADHREEKRREQEMGDKSAASLADLFRKAQEGERKQLNLVLKADVQGSLEAVKQALLKLEEPEVGVEIIHTGVGGVTETDVMLASASDAIIIAFNVIPDSGARQAAEREDVEIRTYRVIYDAIGEVKAAIKGLRAPTFRENVTGHAEVRELFRVPKVGTIAGCHVTDGRITRKSKIRVVRDGTIVHEGGLASLKHFKDDVKEIAAGYDCGIGIENFQDVKVGDVLEAFVVEEVPG